MHVGRLAATVPAVARCAALPRQAKLPAPASASPRPGNQCPRTCCFWLSIAAASCRAVACCCAAISVFMALSSSRHMSETWPTNFLCTPPICSATAAATVALCVAAAGAAAGAAVTASGEGSSDGDGRAAISSSAARAEASVGSAAAGAGRGAASTRGGAAAGCGATGRLVARADLSAGAVGVPRRPLSLAVVAGELLPVVTLLLLADSRRSEGVSKRGGDCTLASAAAAAAAAVAAATSAAAAACCARRSCSVGVGGGLGHSSGVTSPD